MHVKTTPIYWWIAAIALMLLITHLLGMNTFVPLVAFTGWQARPVPAQ